MGRTILVTGVSRGLGLVVCRTLLEEGWQVHGVSRTLTEEIEALARVHPDTFHFHPFDLGITDDIASRLFGDRLPLKLPLDGVVNNAAVAYDDLVTNLDLDALRRMYALNVFTPMAITKGFLRNRLFHRAPGALVHVSSVSVHTGYKGLAMYASTKGALEAFSRNVAREWGGRGIRSNCVVAGFMDTAMSRSLTPEQRTRIHQRTALKAPARLESVAATIRFLLSEDADSITGQNLFVDSGTL